MNIKVKMPQPSRLKKGTWGKELLMTFLGTTISIVLTFGTAQMLEHKNQKAIGRQAAMMVIHDIDNSVESLWNLATEEDNLLELTQYVMENIDSMGPSATDTLMKVLKYLYAPYNTQGLDDVGEKIFLGSNEGWKNIDNTLFVDVVQDFYHQRHSAIDLINASPRFHKPLSEEEVYKYLTRPLSVEKIKPLLIDAFQREEVQRYLTHSSERRLQYNTLADKWSNISDQCKFIMGITNREVKEYVEKREQTGKRVREKDLIGSWREFATPDRHSYTQFNKDHTYTTTEIYYQSDVAYTGYAKIKWINTGTWELIGDSVCQKTLDLQFELDTTGIRYLPEKKKEVELWVKIMKENLFEHQKKVKPLMVGKQERYAMFIDASGEKIEYHWTGYGSDKEYKIRKGYFTKEI